MPSQPSAGEAVRIEGLEDLEEIGRGGFATVYRARQPEFHRTVAVKVIDPGHSADAEPFRREVRAMGSLSDHPNVVPVYGAGTVDDRSFLVMPLLAGGSLEDRLREGPVDAAEVVRIGAAVAGALDAAHGIGLLHRDVKPANILFTSYGEPKLTDFGIARFSDATVTQGVLTATVTYAAPEVLEGQPASVASDVYALGATLHAALRGASPFSATAGEPPMATAMRVVHEAPPSLRDHGVPPALAAVVERAMAKDPHARHGSAAELQAALEAASLHADAAAQAEPTVAAAAPTEPMAAPVAATSWPAPAEPSAPEQSRGVPPAWWLAAAVALVVVLAVGYALWPRSTATTTTTTAPSATTTERAASSRPSTARPSTTARSTASQPAAPPPSASGAGSPAAAAREYYGIVDASHVDEGWARLSPSYQAEVGRSSYEGFWRTIADVEVLDASEEGRTATVRLRYTRTDGSTSTEGASLSFTPDPTSGALLIDGFRAAG